jgi:heterodisulfide reductase subunit A
MRMTDSVLIVGGGVAGITVAEECAKAGAQAVLVERDAIVGGKLAAAMTQDSSVGDAIDGATIPKLSVLAETGNIEILTLSEVQKVDGRPGNFTVDIRERARFVTDACTLCNHCRPVCPVVRPNEHDAGLSYRKAIYTPLPESLPQEFVIDIDSCLNTPPNYLPCNRCTEVCDDDAIHFDVALDRMHQRQVAAVVIATGFEYHDGSRERGYGSHPDVVTTAEMERLLTAPGPTGGFAAKPSNEDYPNSILFIVDDLSPFSLHTVVSQIERLVAQDIGRIAVLVTSSPGADERDGFQQRLPAGLTLNFGLLQMVEARADNRITVTYADFSSSRIPEEQFDMVVLSSAARPGQGLEDLARTCGCSLAEDGYVARSAGDQPFATSCPGVYVAGAAAGPSTITNTLEEARAVASAALAHIDRRLLRPDAPAADETRAEAIATAMTEEEVRARFERALFTMLESGK